MFIGNTAIKALCDGTKSVNYENMFMTFSYSFLLLCFSPRLLFFITTDGSINCTCNCNAALQD